MKIVLSRKGFDSSNGHIPSPIFQQEDGTLSLYSLPIPKKQATYRYSDIQWNQSNLQVLISSLRRGKKTRPDYPAHLDPDLVRDAVKNRHPDWCPIFGQSGSSETQLQHERVNDLAEDGCGRPLFLYFGWYREVKSMPAGYSYVKKAPNIHALFGWLQVERKIVLRDRERREEVRSEFPWAAHHPHVADDYDDAPNAIYIAPKPGSKADRLILNGRDTGLPAAGMFRRFDPEVHTLTAKDRSRSRWCLPSWFYRDGDPKLGMHKKKSRWEVQSDPRNIHLQSVGKGQEFVLDSGDYDEKQIGKWVERIVRAGQR